jgi:hypothetical protein
LNILLRLAPYTIHTTQAASRPTSCLQCLERYLYLYLYFGLDCTHSVFNSTLFHIPRRRRMLRWDPGLLRLRHWQSDALTTRLDLDRLDNYGTYLQSPGDTAYCFSSAVGQICRCTTLEQCYVKKNIQRTHFQGQLS